MHARRGAMLTEVSRAHALSGLLAVMLTALVGMMILVRPGAAPSLGGVGIGSIAIAVAYLLGVRLVYRDQRVRGAVAAESKGEGNGTVAGEGATEVGGGRVGLAAAIARFAVSALVILVAAPFVASAAGEIAEHSGLGDTFVGTVLVAASTSLPELVATIAAVRMGAFDLAVGNVFGSNTFNMAMLLPIDLFSDGPLLSSIAPTHALTAFWVVIVTSVALMSIVYQEPRRRRFIDPDAVAIIALVCGALITVYLSRETGGASGGSSATPPSEEWQRHAGAALPRRRLERRVDGGAHAREETFGAKARVAHGDASVRVDDEECRQPRHAVRERCGVGVEQASVGE
jgi:cation:H+ antiporter